MLTGWDADKTVTIISNIMKINITDHWLLIRFEMSRQRPSPLLLDVFRNVGKQLKWKSQKHDYKPKALASLNKPF